MRLPFYFKFVNRFPVSRFSAPIFSRIMKVIFIHRSLNIHASSSPDSVHVCIIGMKFLAVNCRCERQTNLELRCGLSCSQNFIRRTTGSPHKRRVWLFVRNIKICTREYWTLNIVNVYREMSTLKLKININLPKLLCIVVSVALNGEFE